MHALVEPLESSWTRSVRDRLLLSLGGNGIFTPATRLITIRTCSRSAACDGVSTRQIGKLHANANAMIFCDIGVLFPKRPCEGLGSPWLWRRSRLVSA